MKYFLLLFFLPSFISCSKYVNEQQEDLLVQAITNGQWKVVSFKRDSADVTSAFSGYSFKFQDNKTVDAIKDSVVVRNGTWVSDLSARTITAGFQDSTEPLSLLNGKWQITNNGWTYVEASQTVNAEIRTLRLEKII